MMIGPVLWLLVASVAVAHDHTVHPEDHPETSPPPHVSDHRFFLQEIFSKYGHGGKMTFEGFEHLLESLGLGNIIITDHDLSAHREEDFRNPHNTHDHSKKDHDHSQHNHASSPLHSTRAPPKVVKTQTSIMQSTDSATTLEHSHKPYTVTADSRMSTSGTEASETIESPRGSEEGKSIYHYRLPEAEIPELLVNLSSLVDQHQELSSEPQHFVMEQCLSPREILEAFGINQNSSLNPVSFLHLCPAIIYELDQGHCLFRNLSHREHHTLATLLQWVYTLLAVSIISLCGFLSVAVIPIMQKWFYQTLLQFLVGLAVGSLSGDGLLHLMPHAMLSGDGGHGSSSLLPEIAEKNAVWRGFAALSGILLFFVAERLLAIVASKREGAPKAQDMRRDSDSYAEEKTGQKLSEFRKNSGLELSNREMMHMLANTSHTIEIPELMNHGHGHSHDVPESVSAVAWMVILGDGLHNFCDGLAIGAAFAAGVESGISTTVAVFCHELPHELGDFAMLLQTGMSARRALLYNFLSSALCLAGAALGLCLGGVTSATGWVFAVTAGIFLYVALVDMLPELSRKDPSSAGAFNQLAIQFLGISTGVSLMLLIANYEQDLQALVS